MDGQGCTPKERRSSDRQGHVHIASMSGAMYLTFQEVSVGLRAGRALAQGLVPLGPE